MLASTRRLPLLSILESEHALCGVGPVFFAGGVGAREGGDAPVEEAG